MIGGDGGGGLEGSQIDESGVLIRWGSSPGMLTSQDQHPHPPTSSNNNYSQRHSSSGGGTTNPLVSPSLGTSQRHESGPYGGGGESGGGDGGFSPHQSGSVPPHNTTSTGFSIPPATFVVEGQDCGVIDATSGIRRRGTGASHERGGHGGERRVSTLWGLDGPLTDPGGGNPHHTRTSSSSMSLNVSSPNTVAMPLPSPHDGDGGYSPTRRYETSSPKTPAVHRGRRSSASDGGSKVAAGGGCCCTLQ